MIPGISQTIGGKPKDVVANSRNLVCETPTLFLDAYLAWHSAKYLPFIYFLHPHETTNTHVTYTISIETSADAPWQVSSDFGEAGDYLAGVIDCTLEGEGVGALRRLTYADSGAIVKRLQTLDVD